MITFDPVRLRRPFWCHGRARTHASSRHCHLARPRRRPRRTLRRRRWSGSEASFAGLGGEAHSGLTRPRLQPRVGASIRGDRDPQCPPADASSAEEELAEMRGGWVSTGRSGVAGGADGGAGCRTSATCRLRPAFRPRPAPPSSSTCRTAPATCRRRSSTDLAGAGRRFKAAAEGLRGVTAWVEREGPIAVGDALRLFVPDQRAWQGLRDSRPRQGRGLSRQISSNAAMPRPTARPEWMASVVNMTNKP